jgi:hypothetical protein
MSATSVQDLLAPMPRQEMMQFYDDVCPLHARAFYVGRCPWACIPGNSHVSPCTYPLHVRRPRTAACVQLLLSIQRSTTGCDTAEGFIVGFDLGNKGKGLVATRAFDKNEEVLRERPFVAVQSLDNRRQVLACANCFRFVGAPVVR